MDRSQSICTPRFQSPHTVLESIRALHGRIRSDYVSYHELELELHSQAEYDTEAQVQGYRAALAEMDAQLVRILGDISPLG